MRQSETETKDETRRGRVENRRGCNASHVCRSNFGHVKTEVPSDWETKVGRGRKRKGVSYSLRRLS